MKKSIYLRRNMIKETLMFTVLPWIVLVLLILAVAFSEQLDKTATYLYLHHPLKFGISLMSGMGIIGIKLIKLN